MHVKRENVAQFYQDVLQDVERQCEFGLRGNGGAMRRRVGEGHGLTDMKEKCALPLKRLTSPRSAGTALWLAGPAGPDGDAGNLWNSLSSGEKDRANRFHRAEDRALFALTRGTLRCLLSGATGIVAEKIAFAEGANGRPYLAGADRPYFSVSHSGSYALIGLSWSRQIGVDIERMRDMSDELSLARLFFSYAEYRALKGQEKDAMLLSFYKIWTCKEAVLKACGAGIAEHLKDFSVELTRDGYTIHPEPKCFSPVLASVTAEVVTVPRGYVGCCAFA